MSGDKQGSVLRRVVAKRDTVKAGEFIFCDRYSGAMRFRVSAEPGGTLPVEQAASLLAMHCLARGQQPADYAILVVPRDNLLDPVGRRAAALLEAGRVVGNEIRLSPREQEVLQGVLRHLSNKEIAAQLNISERTVKFHVSALLAKFKVRDRVGLMREASIGMMPASTAPPGTLFGYSVPPQSELVPTGESNKKTVRDGKQGSGAFWLVHKLRFA